jgi:hypothetical protein
MTWPISNFKGKVYEFEDIPDNVHIPENYISYSQFSSYKWEMQDVLEANQKIIVMLFDMIKEQSEMKKKLRGHAQALWVMAEPPLNTIDEELYQWSKSL